MGSVLRLRRLVGLTLTGAAIFTSYRSRLNDSAAGSNRLIAIWG